MYTGYYELDCTTAATTTLGNKWTTSVCGPFATTAKVTFKYKTGTSCYELEDGWPYKSAWSVNSATTACTVEWTYDNYECTYDYSRPISPQQQLKSKFSQIIQSRCSPNIIVRQNSKRKPLSMATDIREQRARETLRRVIGEQKFVNFMKHGFISVKARSGLVYQIFTGHGITHVFDQGNLVERLCVVLQGNFPPTDSLIMRYLLILNNEQQFRSLAIKHSISGFERSRQTNGPADMKSLAEIFKELKSNVA